MKKKFFMRSLLLPYKPIALLQLQQHYFNLDFPLKTTPTEFDLC